MAERRKPIIVSGYFEYQDPWEPPAFNFDEETKERTGVERLSQLMHKLDPRWYELYVNERGKNKSKPFTLIVFGPEEDDDG